MFSGEGEDLKPDKLKRWLRTVKKHLARSGLNDDSPRVADYYGAYTDGKANNAYQTLDREVEDLTLARLTQAFSSYSKPLKTPITPITSGRMSARQQVDSQHA